MPDPIIANKETVRKVFDEAAARVAMEALSKDYAPLTDMRASADYRIKSARNLLYRFYLETRLVDAMAANELSVFA